MKVELNIADRSQCDKVYHEAFKGNLTDSVICAGTHQKKDTCHVNVLADHVKAKLEDLINYLI
ncbi:hypothetical protein J6590_080771 [Homalodisca vitripennis]|nr:hypothetical protein J6590_080771 [Homalodisca vitripennis]